MKLINTGTYLLLIDEEAEIKKGDYLLEKESIINVFPNYLTDLTECNKIIAYRKLNEKAKELDLPLLPNPFEEVFDWRSFLLEKAEQNNIKDHVGVSQISLGTAEWACKKVEKAVQSKQFSLEDMRKIAQAAFTIKSNNDTLIADFDRWFEKRIQSLSTQQLPKEFIPEYEYSVGENDLTFGNSHITPSKKLKIVTNSESKQIIVGTYKY